MVFGRKLAALRKEKNLTQEELANAVNISKSTIAMYETSKRNPDMDTLKEFATYFNVTTDYLLGRTDIRNNADRISEAIKDDLELFDFWEALKDRPDLQLLFKQTKDLADKDIKQILKIIKTFEDEEGRND